MIGKKDHKDIVELIHEKIFSIFINGRPGGTVSCTPVDLRQLAAGWLLSEGRIQDPSTITDIEVREEDRSIHVLASERTEDDPEETGAAGRNRITGQQWTEEDLQWINRAFEEEPPLRAATKAAHSCMIVRKYPLEILYRSEDAGRHSALDKAIGWAALNKVDLNDCFLMTSGRISTRMAAKAVRSGVSALAGKGTVTAEAVELAEEYGMTLIGYVKENSATWFHE